MSKRNKGRGRKISSRAVVNKIKVDSLPSVSFGISENDIVPYGLDNIYPQRIFNAVSKSPTAKGCIKRFREFVFGLGVDNGGSTIVNADGETLNDVLLQSVDSYSLFNGFALHFNFNILGDITEIYNVDLRFIRKNKSLDKIEFGNWDEIGNYYFSGNNITVDSYDPDCIDDKIASLGGDFLDYKGQVLYWSADYQIYPTSMIDSASISANYEMESQIYSYANIKNGFSGNTIIKYPSPLAGEETVEELGANDLLPNNALDNRVYSGDIIVDQNTRSKLEQDLQKLHGAENAGSSVIVEVPVNVAGELKDFKMVENLSPTNVDDLLVNQNGKAERDLLKVCTMPIVLLGASDNGMFNEASFNDAFNYKNADTEGDRKIVERVFNSVLPNTVFGINEIEIVPLEMKERINTTPNR